MEEEEEVIVTEVVVEEEEAAVGRQETLRTSIASSISDNLCLRQVCQQQNEQAVCDCCRPEQQSRYDYIDSICTTRL